MKPLSTDEISLRILNIKDKEALDMLIKKIENSLINKDFWLPILDEAYEHFFDNKWTMFCGAFKENILIGAAALFFNQFEYHEAANKLNLKGNKIAEIGRCMVLPKYRGNNLMLQINKYLLDNNSKDIKYYIATVHPENISSVKSLQNLGLQKKETFNKNGFLRDIYMLEK